ncbi:hypothetical protein VTN00DRAFT_5486 [Thermoascus crustaceus]|uniref:uncharacterized protein n=1 Tax=Thermoascus crustaceus TaxID=5088 RepID=UPI0037423A07
MQHLTLDPQTVQPPTRDLPSTKSLPADLPPAKQVKLHPERSGGENASLYFVGTATTILEWEGIRLMTDPNFLHAGDHVHLGPGVSSMRKTNPAVDLHDLPRIDAVLLSHYHGDHFDQKVESSLRRDLPIITTPHAKSHLTSKPGPGESFNNVFELDVWQQMMIDVKRQRTAGDDDHTMMGTADSKTNRQPRIRVTAMPGKHVPGKILQTLNDLAKAIPPTNGWMLELGYTTSPSPSPTSTTVAPPSTTTDFTCGYRIYITGDTLPATELHDIPHRYTDQNQPIDLMLLHLGGTTVPTPAMLPLAVMVTMDAKQGIELVRLIRPDVTVPIHYDDYDIFASPLEDFVREVEREGMSGQVVFLDRGEGYRFRVRG